MIASYFVPAAAIASYTCLTTVSYTHLPLSTKNQRDVRTIVVSTVEEVLEDAASGVFIDADYVKTEYEDKISQVEDIVKNVMSEAERSEFITYVRNNVCLLYTSRCV